MALWPFWPLCNSAFCALLYGTTCCTCCVMSFLPQMVLQKGSPFGGQMVLQIGVPFGIYGSWCTTHHTMPQMVVRLHPCFRAPFCMVYAHVMHLCNSALCALRGVYTCCTCCIGDMVPQMVVKWHPCFRTPFSEGVQNTLIWGVLGWSRS